MSEVEIIKLVFGIFLSAWVLVLFLLAFRVYYKYLVQEKKCTEETVGRVVRYTWTTRGGEDSGVCLPGVAYNVDGKEYRVTGPEYRGYRIQVKKTPLSENSCTSYEKDQILYITRTVNSMIGFYKNSMQELYPIHTRLVVFYCPEKPGLAYVLRYCDRKWAFWLTFLAGLSILVILILMLLLL